MKAPPRATVLIVTRNRKQVLRAAIESALAQDVSPEVLVIDDASDDGTAQMVGSTYPEVRLVQSTERLGLIVQRNRGARLANAPILVSLDDDAVFTSASTIAEVLPLFANPIVGAVRIPHVNIIGGERNEQFVLPMVGKELNVASAYIGCAHALRRDLFNALGGYIEPLFQWGEEAGFCQKLYDAGYVVAIADVAHVHHFPHPAGRGSRSKDVWIHRNRLLVPFCNAPTRWLPREWLLAVGISLGEAVRAPTKALIVLEGIARGLGASVRYWRLRRPVSSRAYSLFKLLQRRKVLALHDARLAEQRACQRRSA